MCGTACYSKPGFLEVRTSKLPRYLVWIIFLTKTRIYDNLISKVIKKISPMKYKHLLEMPELVSSEDWHLSDPLENQKIANQILNNNPTVIKAYNTSKLFHQGGNIGGQVGLINDKNQLEYYMHYEKSNNHVLGNCAAQIKVWRSRHASVVGIATTVFDGWLLVNFDTMISDSRHTERGKEFWITQLSGHVSSHTIGIVRYDDISVYDPAQESIADWIEGQYAWGRGKSFRNLRFFISNLTITEKV